MKRLIEEKLLAWKNNPEKKPLIIFGARQVGKSHTLVDFGTQEYSNVAYFYFENNLALQEIFNKGVDDIRVLITELEAHSGKTITAGSTLIISDEIQACNAALSSLKRFYEVAPEYHIACAGSLLGLSVKREGYSFPVGKVELLNMYPMNFKEFLWAVGNESIISIMENAFENDVPLSSVLHEKALEYYRTYLVVGGMPEAVKTYIEKKDFTLVKAKQMYIHSTYYNDMSNYSTTAEANRARAVYNNIPAQLAKANHKFQYALIKSGGRAKEFESGLDWLKTAGIVLSCVKIKEGKVPISMFADTLSYKIYMADVGLFTAKADFPISSILTNMNLGDFAKGALSENYVAQQFASAGKPLYYWESEGKAEVDFVLQGETKSIPVEVKSADNVKSQSLSVYVKKYATQFSIRISTKNFGFENGIKSVPLYAVWCIK